MNVDANKTAVKRFLDVMEKNRPQLLDELCAKNFVIHWPGGGSLTGLAEAKELVGRHSSTLSVAYEIKDLVAENDMVAARLVQHGTHKGEWAGAWPTGKKFSILEYMFFRFRDDKIVEIWPLPDIERRKKQLGFRSLPPDD